MRLLGVLSVAACVASAAAHACAQSARAASPVPSAPVTISVCSGGIHSIEFVEIASYDVTLRNTTSVPADEVRFSARYGRHEKRATFDVRAPFPPGADVSRHVRRTVNGGLFAYVSDTNDCTVDYVHFTNGGSWTRPAR